MVSGLLEHLLTDVIDYDIGDQLIVDINTHIIDMTGIVNMICESTTIKTKLPLVCVSMLREVYYASQQLFFADQLTYDYLFPQMVADYRVKESERKSFGRCLQFVIDELLKCLSISFDTLLERVNAKWNAERNSKIVTDDTGAFTLDKSYEDILDRPPVKSQSESNILDKANTGDDNSNTSASTTTQKTSWTQQLTQLITPKSRPPMPTGNATGKSNGNAIPNVSGKPPRKPPVPTGNPTVNTNVNTNTNVTPVPSVGFNIEPIGTRNSSHRNSLPTSTVIHPLKPIATKMSVIDVPIDADLNEEDCNRYITFFDKHYRVHDVKTLPNGTFIPKHALIDGIIAYATKLIPNTHNPGGEYNITLHVTHKGNHIDLTNDYELVLNKYRPKMPLPDDYIVVIARVYHMLHLNPYIEENSLIDIIFDMDRSIGLIDKNEIIMCIKCALHEYRSKPGITAFDMVMNVNDDWNHIRDDVLRYSNRKQTYVLNKKAHALSVESVQKVLKYAV